MVKGNWGALLGALLISVVVSVTGAAAAHVTTQGPAGPRGPQGIPGVAGIDGATGDTGATGATGPQGATSVTSVAATTASVAGSAFTYHLNIADLADSFIQIPSSNVSLNGPIASNYLAGRTPIYDSHNVKVGTESATFITMQTTDGIFSEISSDLSTNSGLIASWTSPGTPSNLQLDSIIRSMAATHTVTIATKTGSAHYFGKTYSLVVSSNSTIVYFKFTPMP